MLVHNELSSRDLKLKSSRKYENHKYSDPYPLCLTWSLKRFEKSRILNNLKFLFHRVDKEPKISLARE